MVVGWPILGFFPVGNDRPEAAICHDDDSFILQGGLPMTELLDRWTLVTQFLVAYKSYKMSWIVEIS